MKSIVRRTAPSRGIRAVSAVLFLILAAGFSTAAVSYVRLQPVSAELTAPRAVALDDAENLYVVESTTNLLHVMSAAGAHLNSVGNLDRPMCVAVDSQGRILVGNAGRGNVEVYDRNFALLFKLGAGNGEFSLPNSIALDQTGRVYVADTNADKIKVYNADGTFSFSFGTSGSTAGKFHFPTSIAIDGAAQELYVIDLPVTTTRDGSALGARVQVFTLAGVYKRGFGKYGQGDGMLTRPQGIAVDAGKVYVTDSYQHVAEIFDTVGTFQATVYDLGNPMRSPLGITTNHRGIFYIASMNTGKVEVYSITP
jgi:DNA-binding beta-propeller fold protein YncE